MPSVYRAGRGIRIDVREGDGDVEFESPVVLVDELALVRLCEGRAYMKHVAIVYLSPAVVCRDDLP